jgi:hypothetical protein
MPSSIVPASTMPAWKTASRARRLAFAAVTPLLAGLVACASAPPPAPGLSEQELQRIRDGHDQSQQRLDTAIDTQGKQTTPAGAEPQPHSEAPPPKLDLAPAASASPSGRPSWIDRPNDRHPDAQFLVAVGTGDTLSAAQDNAKFEIAKIFEAQVQGVSETFKEYTSKAGQKDLAVRASSYVQVSTTKALRCVQIAESWTSGSTTYALAVIERAPAARIVFDDIQRLDGDIRGKMSAGDAAKPDKVKGFRAYGAAFVAMGEREGLNADLKMIAHGSGVAPPISWGDIAAKFDVARDSLKVGLDVAAVIRMEQLSDLVPDEQERIQSCLLQELGKMGLQVADDDAGGYDLLLRVRADFAPVDVSADAAVVRVDLALDVSDGKKKLATWTESEGRVSRPNVRAAVSTAATKICMRAVPAIAAKLNHLMHL